METNEPAKSASSNGVNMKLAIVGGRDFTSNEVFDKVIKRLLLKDMFEDVTEIVSGGARGVDTLAENYADNNGLLKTIFPADWASLGKSAGYIRNNDIVKYADIGIAFWDGKSKGTKHTIDLMGKQNKTIVIVCYEINNGLFEIRKIYPIIK